MRYFTTRSSLVIVFVLACVMLQFAFAAPSGLSTPTSNSSNNKSNNNYKDTIIQPISSSSVVESSILKADASVVDNKLVVNDSPTTTTTTTSHTSSDPIPHQRKKSTRCHAECCTSKIARLIGHCQYCDYSFCASHRLPESHKCDRMDCVKERVHKELEDRLMREKTVDKKVADI